MLLIYLWGAIFYGDYFILFFVMLDDIYKRDWNGFPLDKGGRS